MESSTDGIEGEPGTHIFCLFAIWQLDGFEQKGNNSNRGSFQVLHLAGEGLIGQKQQAAWRMCSFQLAAALTTATSSQSVFIQATGD